MTENTHDDRGRRLSLLLKLLNKTIRITNIYSLNSPSKAYFQQLATWTLSHPVNKHIMGGDFNSVMTESEDRRRPVTHCANNRGKGQPCSPLLLPTLTPSQGRTTLAEYVENTGLHDLWRLTHPIEREYTHISGVHGTVPSESHLGIPGHDAFTAGGNNTRRSNLGPCSSLNCDQFGYIETTRHYGVLP